jgi:STE24 endopeptidase
MIMFIIIRNNFETVILVGSFLDLKEKWIGENSVLEYIFSMNNVETILTLAGIILLNILYMFWFRGHIKRYFKKSGSPELTLDHMRIFNQYINILLILITSFSITFIVVLKLTIVNPSPYFTILGVVCAFVVLGVLILCNQLILHPVIKEIRRTTESRKEKSGEAIRGILLIFVPMIVMFAAIILLQNLNFSQFLNDGFGAMLIPLAIVILFQFVMPLFIGLSLKATPMEDSEMKDRLLEFMNKSGLKRVRIYSWPTKKSKTANALVTGFGLKRIFIADYLIDHFTEEEVMSVLAHEIGHIKRFHLWIRLGLIIIFILLMFGLGSLFDLLEEQGYTVPIWLVISIFILILGVYLVVFLRFFFRIQERQADEYVLQLGIDYRVYAHALLKLARLNHMLPKMNKLDEKFQTHPSIARRVNWVIEKANGDPSEIEII